MIPSKVFPSCRKYLPSGETCISMLHISENKRFLCEIQSRKLFLFTEVLQDIRAYKLSAYGTLIVFCSKTNLDILILVLSF